MRSSLTPTRTRTLPSKIQRELEERGWLAFRDETDVRAGDALPRELAEAIDRAELFVALVSEAYIESDPCRWELDNAQARTFNEELRVVPLKLGGARMPPQLRAALYVSVTPGQEAAAVEEILRERRMTEQRRSAARPDERSQPAAETAASSHAPVSREPRDLVREAVRYARELEALAQIDEALIEAQHAVEGAARSYNEEKYLRAYELWQEAWVRRTSPITDPELVDRIQVVGSLLSEVVLSDRTPQQLRPWLVQRAVTSARAALGYAMRGEPLPPPTFPGTVELVQILGKGDHLEDPFALLRERLHELGTPRFHPGRS